MTDTGKSRVLGGMAPLLAIGTIWYLNKFDFFSGVTPVFKVFVAAIISALVLIFGRLMLNIGKKTA